ncbi:putative CoA-binding protein [Marinitoga piezophila KA3]|uniref:Putative CoA-binding protein n=1 Tax=Marinitoga piezophila (strain DSM 14283 / JCM 11233 / KA3) TaxID=443254 RepID=H2J3Y2_MARPK|nr:MULTISPECIES: CoA-binding protein [Marinitoga]AEX84710.1 putative CoA-binding protein [Marinitoga piezophila KA3]
MIDISKIKKIALIGATTNKSKFGYKILKDLVKKGYEVLPVTPNYDEIEGIKTYKSVNELPEVDVLNFVVPPKIGLEITKEAYKNGFKKFWYQPGAESQEIKEFLDSLNDPEVDYLFYKCIMVETI